jgi:hypothetical protein
MHYYAKRRLDLPDILSRIRGGSSLRDIGRVIGCSRTAVAHAVVRLGRQAIASHCALFAGWSASGAFVFDGLMSAVASRDYPSHITTLVDASTEMVLAMTHCVTERGGKRTAGQRRRIEAKRVVWKPRMRALSDAISLLIHELPRFTPAAGMSIDIDEHPLYPRLLAEDLALSWYESHQLLQVRRTPATAPRTTTNRLFAVNYVDRMIRHRLKEHTRQSIAIGRNATMQMLRMWLFAWDHNVTQPHRVKPKSDVCRAIRAGIDRSVIKALTTTFYTRRVSLRSLTVPESMRSVWLSVLDSPPLRWKTGQRVCGPSVPAYALRDLASALPQAP